MFEHCYVVGKISAYRLTSDELIAVSPLGICDLNVQQLEQLMLNHVVYYSSHV